MSLPDDIEKTDNQLLQDIRDDLQDVRKSIDADAAWITRYCASEETAKDIKRVGWRIFLSFQALLQRHDEQAASILKAIKNLTYVVAASAIMISLSILIS